MVVDEIVIYLIFKLRVVMRWILIRKRKIGRLKEIWERNEG